MATYGGLWNEVEVETTDNTESTFDCDVRLPWSLDVRLGQVTYLGIKTAMV